VFGTYATLFPSSVGLMVLDGNVNPMQNLEQIAHVQGTGQNTRINYGLYSCSARNIEEPGSCPVDDLSKCISDINTLQRTEFQTQPGDESKENLAAILELMYGYPDRAQELCDLAAGNEVDLLLELIEELELALDDDAAIESRQGSTVFEFNSESGPTTSDEDTIEFFQVGPVYGNPDYNLLFIESVPTALVNAQDAFSALYDADYFARRKSSAASASLFCLKLGVV